MNVGGKVSVDMARVKARRDAIVQESRRGVQSWLEQMDNCTVFEGHARFESAHTISVGDDRLTADRIFINVGGRASMPKMPGLEQIEFFNNSSLLEIDFVPKHLIVVGGSYIGLEFGQMFRRFGSEVTIIEMGPRLLSAKIKTCPLPSTRSSRVKKSRFGSTRNVSSFSRRRRRHVHPGR